MPRKKTDTEKCKHSHSKERKKKFFLLSPVFVFDSSVVISVFFFASSFKCVILCVRRRVVLLGAKLKHFDLQIAIDYNTITARTTTLPDPSSWRPINLQNNDSDINSIEKESAANIMYLKSTIKWNAAAVVVVFFCSSLFSFNNSLLVDIVVGFLWACYGYRKSIYIFIVHIQSNGNRQMKGNFCGCLWMGFQCSRSILLTMDGDDFLFEFSRWFFFLLLLLPVVLDSSVFIHCLMIAL